MNEFERDADCFVVLKQMRDFPPHVDPVEARVYHGLLFDQVFVCASCAGWYGSEAVRITGHEATR